MGAKLLIDKRKGAYRTTLKTFGNLFNAQAVMLTSIYVDADQFTAPCVFIKGSSGWRCTGKVTAHPAQ